MRVVVAAVLLVGLVGRPASVQAEGPGLRVGDSLVLHLGGDVGAGYDTNLFYNTGKPNDPVLRSFYVAVRPALSLATRPAQRDAGASHTVDFRLSAALPLRFLTSNNGFINGHYSVGAELGAQLAIFPYGPYAFDIFESFVRTSQTPYAVTAFCFVGAQAGNMNTILNNLGARARIRPGGGRLEGTLQYTFGVNYFEQSCLTPKSALTNDFQVRVKWNFFPKTAIYLNLSEYIFTPIVSGPNTPPPMFPFRAVLGLKGLITPTFNVDVNLGYGNSFTQRNANQFLPNPDDPTDPLPPESYNNVIALVDLEWRATATTNLQLGYRHDFAPAIIGTWFSFDQAYLGLTQQIRPLLNLVGSLRFAWERRDYKGNAQPDGMMSGRIDNLLILHADFAFPIRDWVAIVIGNDLALNFSNCGFTGDPAQPACEYTRNDTWLRASFAY